MTGGNIEKGNFVGAFIVVTARDLNRVSGVADTHEVNALHDAPLIDIKAGNDALGERHQSLPKNASTMVCAAARSSVPS